MQNFRGATLNSRISRALGGILTYPRQLTYAPTSQNTLLFGFQCALSGPFDGLFPTRLSASRILCGGIAAFISASTVYCIQMGPV